MALDSINKVVDNVDINFNKRINNKFVSWILGVLLFIILSAGILAFIFIDKLNDAQIMIASIFGSFLVSILILLITLNNEKRMDYLEAKKSANVLSQFLKSVNDQTIQITNGFNHAILFPSNWLDLYLSCTLYLKYNYLDVLLNEFKFAEQINNCLELTDKQKLVESRKDFIILNKNIDFNILEVQLNLFFFSRGQKEIVSWKESKEYKRFAQKFQVKYSNKIDHLALDYLKVHGNTDSHIVNLHIQEMLRKDNTFQEFIKKQKFSNSERELSNEIYKTFLNTNSSYQKDYKLVWGELLLK